MYFSSSSIFWIGFYFSLVHSAFTVQVQLSTGLIEGKPLTASYSPLGNQSGHVFLGIPYAQPPVGDLRFRRPIPPNKWEGILETKEYKPACMSDPVKTYKKSSGGPISEDCLYANVFTNAYCLENKNCSVMIIIHGGGYFFESASAYNPEILINNFVGQGRNIVVVAINYRLGVFGFGHFYGDDGSSKAKNVALFDVLLAVKWVRKEIKSFGGNNDRITMAGHSAGSGMVFYFTSSPCSKGLIHQQIIMSGPLSHISKMSNYKASTDVARRVGCLPETTGFEKLSQETISKVYKCLRKASAHDILRAEMHVVYNTTYFLGAPCIDGEFVTDYQDRLFEQKKIYPISTMLGTTSAELRVSKYVVDDQNSDKKQYLLWNLCEHIGYELYKNPSQFSIKCYDFYYGNNSNDAQFLSDDMEFYSQAIQISNAHKANNTKVFLYNYIYQGAGAAFNKYLPTIPSPTHSEDLIYVFGTHRAVFAPKDYKIEQIYSGLFANFVNSGDPSPSKEQTWNQYSPNRREYFEIDFNENQNFSMPGMKSNYYSRAHDFWINGRFQKHYKDHFSPSLDTFIITKVASPIISHLINETNDQEKSFEQMEKLFYEREHFLEELKVSERRIFEEKKKEQKKFLLQEMEMEQPMKTGMESGGSNILIFLIAAIGSALLIVFIIIPRLTSRNDDYQLLEGN